MAQAFDYNKFTSLIHPSQLDEALSYYRLFEEENYDKLKALFICKNFNNASFEAFFKNALLLLKNSVIPLNDSSSDSLYNSILYYFFYVIDQSFENYLKTDNKADCLLLVRGVSNGILKNRFLNTLPEFNTILNNETLLDEICGEITEKLSMHFDNYRNDRIFALNVILEFYFIFSLLSRESRHKNYLYLAYYVLHLFTEKHCEPISDVFETQVRTGYPSDRELFLSLYNANQTIFNNKILSVVFYLIKLFYSENIPPFNYTFLNRWINNGTRSFLTTFKEVRNLCDTLSPDKIDHNSEHEAEFLNAFGKLNKLYNDLSQHEKIIISALALFPDADKKLFLTYGYFKALDSKNILKRYALNETDPEKRVMHKMRESLCSQTECYLSEEIYLLRRNILIYKNTFLHFINSDIKNTLLISFVGNDLFFENLCQTINSPSAIEVEHAGFYVWHLTAKNYIKHYYTDIGNGLNYYHIYCLKDINKKDYPDISIASGINRAKIEELIKEWETLLKKEFVKIALLQSRPLLNQTIIILNKERELTPEVISAFFEIHKKENVTINAINEVIDLWHNNLSDKELIADIE